MDSKKTMLKGDPGVFASGWAKTAEENFIQERKELQAKIGELTIDQDCLREKSK